jgi:putative DNA primase/helicase
MRLAAQEIHASIGSAWPQVLARLGIPEEHLRKKAGPCPACGGRDRFTFDNRNQRGDFFCRQCGPGDGFELLERVHRWTFSEARRRVVDAAGLQTATGKNLSVEPKRIGPTPAPIAEASPSQRVVRLVKGSCAVADCADAVTYLESRALWPLPERCTLRAHPSVEYFEDGNRIGRFPALIAPVKDINGELVTAHVTYLSRGQKLEGHEPRKILSPLTERIGCAVRLVDLEGATLGIAEGIETALAAQRMTGVPTWAALNAGLLQKFEPPLDVKRVVIFADRDVPGLEAAALLTARLNHLDIDLKLPPAPWKDWNDGLRGAA